jgi:subtilisin family serine protease
VSFAPPYSNGLGTTWGLKATGVAAGPPSRWTGFGIRVAILDTGIDLHHSDLKERVASARSFVPALPVQDAIGHGTHCAGTIAGHLDPHGYRYGIAHGVELCIARVFDAAADTARERLIEAMDWAVSMGCRVIALPLGSMDATPADDFEAAGARALAAGCLVIAAAGNARSKGVVQPANSPSILAVGAVDNSLALAPFSPGAADGAAGSPALIAPGVGIYSTAPANAYAVRTGTSMAAAHVAGVAALWAEAEGLRGRALWQRLVERARPIGGVGSGSAPRVVTAPSSDFRLQTSYFHSPCSPNAAQ